MYFVYDCIQYLAAPFMLPRLKKHLSAYLGLSLPEVKTKKGQVFLIYAVSMGETKIAAALFSQMKELYSDGQFYILSRTETGHLEAKRSMSDADGHFLMPLDFSWAMRRFLKRLQPDNVIIIESDFWLNFMRISKEMGAKLFLVSGKISCKSFSRFQKFPFFSKRLFSLFDWIGAQNALVANRFIKLGVDPAKVLATGNLKFDAPFPLADTHKLKQILGIVDQDRVVVVASTHAGEEEAILESLVPLLQDPHVKLIFVPRHPERFGQVEELLKGSFPTISYSKIQERTGKERLILIDTMGLLLSVYQIGDVAIVGGSFLSSLKGHNIFEPVQAGVPVLFGPYMSDQKDLVECVLASKAGMQVSLRDLGCKVKEILEDSSLRKAMQLQQEKLSQEMRGSSERTLNALSEKILST